MKQQQHVETLFVSHFEVGAPDVSLLSLFVNESVGMIDFRTSSVMPLVVRVLNPRLEIQQFFRMGLH
jgi:hypothetical protein